MNLRYFLAALLVVGLCIVAAVFVLQDPYEASITGTVSYNPIHGWSVSVDDITQQDGGLLPMWGFPWDSGDIIVEAQLGYYSGDTGVNNINIITGGSSEYQVSVGLPHTGYYSGQLRVYEIQRNLLGFETGRTQVATKNIEVNIS